MSNGRREFYVEINNLNVDNALAAGETLLNWEGYTIYIYGDVGNSRVIYGGKTTTNKHEFVDNDHSILIDDMRHNLDPWGNAGGTSVDFKKSNKDIINQVKKALELDIDINQIKKDITISTKKTEKNPTVSQKEAGNYKKGSFKYKGLDISIENPKGSVRWGIGLNGKKWRNVLKNHYGYIKKTNGADGDHVDIFVGDNLRSTKVFIVNQNDPKTGIFDEHKIIVGATDTYEAEKIYRSNYDKGWKGLGNIEQCTVTELKKWLHYGDTNIPYEKA